MNKRSLLFLLPLAVGVAQAGGDQPAKEKSGPVGRVVEGTVVAADRTPIAGAKVLFEPARAGIMLEGMTATTNAQGRFRVDLSEIPWSRAAIRVLVLAPGYKAPDKKVAAGTGTVTVDFALVPEPWRETMVQVEDQSGKPVAGVEVTCKVGRVTFAKYKTDALGGCRIAMARDLGMKLSTAAKDARPTEAYLPGTKDDPPSVALPLLPAIRGRVVDHEGRPVPNTAVGRWLHLADDGVGDMLSFFDGSSALTDCDGNFVIAPTLEVGVRSSRPAPTVGVLCFAEPSYRSKGWLLFHPNRPIRVAYQLFDPRKKVAPITVTLKPSRRVRIPITRGFVMPKRKAEYASTIEARPHKDKPDWRFLLISDDTRRTKESLTEPGKTLMEEFLPEGSYHLTVELWAEETDALLGEAKREFVVPPGEGPLDLPPLALEPPSHRKLIGKPAPEIDAVELDTGRPVKLSDFRGKVVLLDFWGYWCGVCIGKMPQLAELNRKYAGRPLVILALHDQSVQSRVAYDAKLSTVRQRVWGGHDLPFRVLLDRSDPAKPDDLNPEGQGTTVKRYGVTGFPTLYLIDRDGILIGLVDIHNPDQSESLIRKEVERAERAR